MNRKLPPEAFDFYLSLGLTRSYKAVAKKYDVTKVAVTNLAIREKWQERIERIESTARENSDKKAIETREQLNERYLKMWQAVERRALEALRSFPFDTAMDAARALDLATKNVRLIKGEPTERSEVSIEEMHKREIHQFLEVVEDGEPEPNDEDGEDQQAAPV